MSDGYWRDNIACKNADPALFDPPRAETDLKGRVERAKRYCERCPVAAACAEDAVKHRDSGVRAGVMLIDGQPAPRRGNPGMVNSGDVDDVAVEMAMHGLRMQLNRREREAAVLALAATGLSAGQIAERLHMNYRSVLRWLLRNGKAAA